MRTSFQFRLCTLPRMALTLSAYPQKTYMGHYIYREHFSPSIPANLKTARSCCKSNRVRSAKGSFLKISRKSIYAFFFEMIGFPKSEKWVWGQKDGGKWEGVKKFERKVKARWCFGERCVMDYWRRSSPKVCYRKFLETSTSTSKWPERPNGLQKCPRVEYADSYLPPTSCPKQIYIHNNKTPPSPSPKTAPTFFPQPLPSPHQKPPY